MPSSPRLPADARLTRTDKNYRHVASLADKQSLMLDLKILFRTFAVALNKNAAY
jgi:hypothetical protein